jgi:hypothetical protein
MFLNNHDEKLFFKTHDQLYIYLQPAIIFPCLHPVCWLSYYHTVCCWLFWGCCFFFGGGVILLNDTLLNLKFFFCVCFVLLYMGKFEFKIDSKNDSKIGPKNDSKLHSKKTPDCTTCFATCRSIYSWRSSLLSSNIDDPSMVVMNKWWIYCCYLDFEGVLPI